MTRLVKSLPLSLTSSKRRVVFLILSFLSFAVPFSLGHPQLLVGSLVNAALIVSVIFLPQELFLPLIIFPSLAVLSRGIIFGPLSIFLVYMVPFIWLGNLALVLSFKKAYSLWGNKAASLFLSALVKQAWLFGSAWILVKLSILPKIFLTTMGIYQFITAILGGSMVLILINRKRTMR